MLINIGIFYFLLLYFFNLGGTDGVATDDKVVNEYEKSQNIPKKKSRFHFEISKDKLMWKDASLACKKKGMALASLDTLEKRKQLSLALERHNMNFKPEIYEYPIIDYWIGGFRESNDFSKFQWENGNIIESYGWMDGEPNYCPSEYCVEIKVFNTLLGWNDMYCEKLSRYICMYEDLREETKNTEHMPENTRQPETHNEENKNLEAVEITTEAVELAIDRLRPWQYFKPRRHPLFIHLHDPMLDRLDVDGIER